MGERQQRTVVPYGLEVHCLFVFYAPVSFLGFLAVLAWRDRTSVMCARRYESASWKIVVGCLSGLPWWLAGGTTTMSV